jgi:hypothetical protein
MTASATHLKEPVDGRERLSNWLALLSLVALGIVWPHEDTDASAYLAPRQHTQHCGHAGRCQRTREELLLVARQGSPALRR